MIVERTVAENAWQVEEGLYRILLPLPWTVPFVNAYLIESQGAYMLVDCGLNWEPSLRALGRALKAIGVPPRGLTYLAITHRHLDHAGAAGPVQSRWGGRVLMHPADAAYNRAEGEAVRVWAVEHGMEEAVARKVSLRGAESREALPSRMDPMPLGHPLLLGDFAFDVIPVPGHSPGQVMLREKRRGWLLTADHVLSVLAPNVWVHPGDLNDPMGEYLESLEQTAGMQARLVLPGHGMPMLGGLREGATAMAGFHRQFAALVEEKLEEKRLKTWDLVKLVWPRVEANPEDARFSLSAVLAALRYLANRGAVGQASDGCWEREFSSAGAGTVE